MSDKSHEQLTEEELRQAAGGMRARQADQSPTNLEQRTRRAGGQRDGKIRYAGDEEVTEL